MDDVWKALSDPTRREILDLLREEPKTTTEVVNHFPGMTRFAVMKHLDVLREADLVRTKKEGRKRMNSLNVIPIRRIYDRWVKRYEGLWAGHLTGLKDELEGKED